VKADIRDRPDTLARLRKAQRLVRAVRRFIAAEARHARKGRAEERLAGRGMQPGEFRTTSRDEVDLAHADLMSAFSAVDCDDVLSLLAALTRPPA
jgi:hypothetical protein